MHLKQGIMHESIRDLLIAGASRVLFNQCNRAGEVGLSFLEGIDAEASAAGHGEVGESFVGVVSLAVMMRKGLGHFGQDDCRCGARFPRRSSECSDRARFGKQALIERVPH